MARRCARDAAMKLLYEHSMGGSGSGTLDELITETIGEQIDDVDLLYIDKITQGVAEKQQEIDGLIDSFAIDWSTGRMSRVDMAILRLAIFEMLYCDEIPVNVSVSEAVELAKVYGSEKSPAFINGILGSFARKQHAGEAGEGEQA
ncbi:MAG: transcription antitermination factor NusB [Christensenellales bacterium]|jgi:N utilization substance protein B